MNQILDSFLDEMPSQQIFVITGVRGAGKTVLMTEVSKKIASHMDWVVVELNPERDMLNSLAAKLSSDHTLAGIFQSAKINLSFFGFGVEIGGVPPITDIEMALTRMLMSLKKSGKKVLITVDEAVNTRNMRAFVSAFQILIRQDLPVFLLMTGLYENVHTLQNEKSLTFLYRAPKIELKPLNIGIIADNYQINFKIDREKALDMAKMTKGYAFAFQALGYFCWEQGVLSEPGIRARAGVAAEQSARCQFPQGRRAQPAGVLGHSDRFGRPGRPRCNHRPAAIAASDIIATIAKVAILAILAIIATIAILAKTKKASPSGEAFCYGGNGD